jgi:hypothetical protein
MTGPAPFDPGPIPPAPQFWGECSSCGARTPDDRCRKCSGDLPDDFLERVNERAGGARQALATRSGEEGADRHPESWCR